MIGLSASVSTPTLTTWRQRMATYPDRAAERVATAMQGTARNGAPKRTEAMAFSTSVVSRRRNDYATNVAGAHELNPTAEFFPEPALPEAGEAVVAVGVTYGQLVNDGTPHQAAQPWFDQAALETEQALGTLADAEWQATP